LAAIQSLQFVLLGFLFESLAVADKSVDCHREEDQEIKWYPEIDDHLLAVVVVIDVQHIKVYHALNNPQAFCRLKLRENWSVDHHIFWLRFQPLKVVYL
jgi:hypothetical protein